MALRRLYSAKVVNSWMGRHYDESNLRLVDANSLEATEETAWRSGVRVATSVQALDAPVARVS